MSGAGPVPAAGERNVLRARLAYAAVAWVFAGCVVLQVFLVGLDLFVADTGASLHRDFAYSYGWLAAVMVLLAGIARLPLRTRLLTAALLLLFAVQTVLPALASGAPVVAGAHSVNALAIFSLAIVLARRAHPLEQRESDGG